MEKEEHTREWMEKTQNEMRKQLDISHNLTGIRYVAGADLTFDGDLYVGCLVVCDINDLSKPVYSKCTAVNVDIPYIPTFLCFREGPVVLQMLKEFQDSNTGINIDLIIVDGSGVWHPRAIGLGAYVGLKSGIPTCGVSKTYLYLGEGKRPKEIQAESQNRCPNKGDYWINEYTIDDGTKVQCAIMRTTDSHPFNPIYLSAGYYASLESIIPVIKSLCHYREPEPVRLADRISRRYVAAQKHKQNTNTN